MISQSSKIAEIYTKAQKRITLLKKQQRSLIDLAMKKQEKNLISQLRKKLGL